MTTQTLNSTAVSTSGLLPAAFFMVIGMAIVFASGLAQAPALHDAAHDVRHATGFPCH